MGPGFQAVVVAAIVELTAALGRLQVQQSFRRHQDMCVGERLLSVSHQQPRLWPLRVVSPSASQRQQRLHTREVEMRA